MVDSLREAKTLANIAVDYIRTHSTDDPLFKDYFGAINSSHPQWRVFTVCPGYAESNSFLMEPNAGCGQQRLSPLELQEVCR